MDNIAISVQGVSKSFKLPHEKQSSVKSLFVSLFRGKRTYERQQVLRNISLDIEEGEFFGIVGRNGGGKSTLLKLLAGVYSPDSGHIQVNGKLTPFIELGVGFNPELSGRENVYLNGALLGFSNKQMDEMYDDIVAFAELSKFMDQKLKNYSSGMQVRLAFSIAIRAQSDILLLDEVLAVGDAAFQQKCFDYFEELKRAKKTVVLVTHDMGAVKRFCSKAIYVKEGKIIHQGSPSEVAEIYIENNIRENVEAAVPNKDHQTAYSIGANISRQEPGEVELEIKYRARNKTEMFVGISLTKDGQSVGEITSDLAKPLVGKGELTYMLSTKLLNPGVYQISGITLFKVDNREILAINKSVNEFVVRGDDGRRGAALKLPDSWEYGKN